LTQRGFDPRSQNSARSGNLRYFDYRRMPHLGRAMVPFGVP
jgi:hypothetical protein